MGARHPLGPPGLAQGAHAECGQRARNQRARALSRPRHRATDAGRDAAQYTCPRFCRSLCALAAERQASGAARAVCRLCRALPPRWPAARFMGAHTCPGWRSRRKTRAHQHGHRRHLGRMVRLDRHALRHERSDRNPGRALGAGAYGYIPHWPVARWGRAWLERGTAECRFFKPVYDGETATVIAGEDAAGLEIIVESRGERCATGRAALPAMPAIAPALASFHKVAQRALRPPADETSLAIGIWLGLDPYP